MGALGLNGPGVVVGSIVGLVLVAKKRSRNGRWPNHILQVVCGGSFSTSGNTRVIPVFFAESNLGGPPIMVFTIKTGITLAVSILVLYVPILVSYSVYADHTWALRAPRPYVDLYLCATH